MKDIGIESVVGRGKLLSGTLGLPLVTQCRKFLNNNSHFF